MQTYENMTPAMDGGVFGPNTFDSVGLEQIISPDLAAEAGLYAEELAADEVVRLGSVQEITRGGGGSVWYDIIGEIIPTKKFN